MKKDVVQLYQKAEQEQHGLQWRHTLRGGKHQDFFLFRHPKKYSAPVATLSRVTGSLTRCCGPSGVPCSQFVTAEMPYLWSTVGNISNHFQSAERSTKNIQKQNNDMYTVQI